MKADISGYLPAYTQQWGMPMRHRHKEECLKAASSNNMQKQNGGRVPWVFQMRTYVVEAYSAHTYTHTHSERERERERYMHAYVRGGRNRGRSATFATPTQRMFSTTGI
ncbi:hypothetical protein TRVL_08856 [Trypanosoma vivax]|nr:hypothetical protein TRVL_08856 [Trypanosoma vivax]